MNTVKHKMKNIMKKMISVVITLAMLVQYLPVNFIRDVFAVDTQALPISISFLAPGDSDTSIKKAGEGNYLLSQKEELTLGIKLSSLWAENIGHANDPKSH